MNFLDKIQEVIYDIIGYLFPGLLATIILIPSIFCYKNTGKISFPIEELVFNNTDKIKFILNMEFLTTKGVFVLILAWLLGHLVKCLATVFYNIVIFIENDLVNGNTKQLSCRNEVLNKSVEIYRKNFQNTRIESYDDFKKENILAAYGRSQIRMYKVSSLVQKYISKYNLYCSLTFICFLIYLNLYIIFLIKYKILIIVSLLIITIYPPLARKMNVKKRKLEEDIKKSELEEDREKDIKESELEKKQKTKIIDKIYLKTLKNLVTFSGVLFFLIIPIIMTTMKYKTMILYCIMCIVSILFYITFDNEYRRHYSLHLKEALCGIIYVDNNEEIKYSLRYKEQK